MFVVISNYDFADNLAPKFHYPKEIERKIKKEPTKHLGSFTTYTDKKTGNVRIYKDELESDTNLTITIDKLEEIELSDLSPKKKKITDNWELV
jgi:hypothetical protein|tara:strand:- start:765 stop:1043 length:279 start_codon:yes stop_codon:yes gene_type:complete